MSAFFVDVPHGFGVQRTQNHARGESVLPIDLILVRHGQSEGNVAQKASKRGDNRFFTPEFRSRHSRTFRLTDRGIKQAKAAGAWLRENVPQPFDRFYVSDYIRAKETAAYLGLPNALWREEFDLRERDRALTDNIPHNEMKRWFAEEDRQYRLDPFLAYPGGGGESLALHCTRLKAGIIEHWARKCSDKRAACVCHGHTMRGLQMEFEGLSHDDFIRLDNSENPADWIRNCQILWYTRRDPETHELKNSFAAVRSICPWEPNGDYGWRRITHKLLANDDLLAEVNRYPRQVNCE